MKFLDQGLRVRLGGMGRVRCEPGWHLGPDWAPRLTDYDLWFVWAGRGRMHVEGSGVDLGPGSVIWMRPGRRYEATQDPGDRLTVNYVHFELQDPQSGRPSVRRIPPVEVMRTRQVDLVDAMLRRVMALVNEPGGRPVAESLFGALLAGLVHEELSEENSVRLAGIEKHHREVVQKAASRIRESPGDAPPVADLARAAGYNADHFSRIFTKAMGKGPQDYIIQAKMERARQLLAESSLSVGMIAEALGFRDIYFFSRQFHQQTGSTPTAYRKSLDSSTTRTKTRRQRPD